MILRISLLALMGGLVAGSAWAQATQGTVKQSSAATAVVHSHTSAATLTITVPSGQYAYVTGLDLSNCEGGGTGVVPASPTYITTTGLNGSPQYQVGSGPATAGVCSPMASFAFAIPLKSQTAGTNVTFVLPTFVSGQTVSLNVYYYLGP